MNIRTATLQDIDQIAAVEKECFPAAEAATKKWIDRTKTPIRYKWR